jgi:peptidoglycan-associated lipoprotein
MKLIKLSVLLVLAVAMTLAATGCKKNPKNVTPLPPSPSGRVGGDRLVDDNAGTFKPADEGSTTGGIPLPDWKPENMNQDRSTFAPFTVYFAYDSAALRSGEGAKIESVAAAMKGSASLYLLIEGHCDERGTEEYNRSLGERRALSLREELVKTGINPDRIRTITYGEDKPAVSGHDESAWGKNRRGEFIACTPKM